MSFDESFWVAFSIIGFMFFFLKLVKKPFCNALNNASGDIENKISESFKIKSEAEAILKEYRIAHAKALNDIKNMEQNLSDEMVLMKENAMKEISAKLKLREEIIKNKISNLETSSLRRLRIKSVKLAVSAAFDSFVQENSELII